MIGISFADPTILSIEDQSVSEDGELELQVLSLNPLDDPMTFQADSDQEWVNISSPTIQNDSTSLFSFTFENNANGQAIVTVTASDSSGSDTEQFTITVTEINDVPVATAASFSTNEDN